MKNEKLYNKTVGILVDAYINDTLIHGNQCGCAVGNIVAANMGFTIRGEGDNANWGNSVTIWQDASWYALVKKYDPNDNDISNRYNPGLAQLQVMSTGYSNEELNLIETHFEHADSEDDDSKWMFNGLMAVIEVLDRIHENTDTVITETSKSKFTRRVLVSNQ